MKFTPLLLAAALQVLPICRVAVVSRAVAWPGSAFVWAWVAAVAAMTGDYHTVSGASAGISGLTKYSNGVPVSGSLTFDVREPVGRPFNYRIIVRNPGSNSEKNYFDCRPLPPGLTINTNVGATPSGRITGTPTNVGTYEVTLLAGNLNYPTPVTATATITIYQPPVPPRITSEPADWSADLGTDVEFRVKADGAPPMSYQWYHEGVEIAGGTSNALIVVSVQETNAGRYWVVVTNAFGSVTSLVAHLDVSGSSLGQLRLIEPVVEGGRFQFTAHGPDGRTFVVWRTADLTQWTPVQTNWVFDGILRFADPEGVTNGMRFYRVTAAP